MKSHFFFVTHVLFFPLKKGVVENLCESAEFEFRGVMILCSSCSGSEVLTSACVKHKGVTKHMCDCLHPLSVFFYLDMT